MGQDDRAGETPQAGGLLLAVVIVSLAGLATSIYLSVLHWQVYNLPGHVSFCSLSEAVNCDTVAMSSYSVVAGVPVSTWAILYYLLVCSLGLWRLRREPPWALFAMLFGASVAASTLLMLVSEFVIRSFCIMCLAAYAVNLANGTLCIFGLRRAGFPVRVGAGWLLLGLAAGAGLFFGGFFAEASESVVLVVGAAVMALGAVAALATRGGDTARVLASVPRDVAAFFRRPLAGAGLLALGCAAVATVVLVTPGMYPPRTKIIAGGLEGMSTGRTSEGHNWIGAEEPDVVITEYSDYECPFCRKAHEVVREIVRERKDWLRLVHVHVPLDDSCNPMLKKPFHRNACDCARAAICADRQDSFWEMNDALFIRRGGLDAGGLTMLADTLGLNPSSFRSCMKDLETERTLQADLQECRQVAQECRRMGRGFGTPTFTVNGQVVVGAKKPDFWVPLVERLRRDRLSPPADPATD